MIYCEAVSEDFSSLGERTERGLAQCLSVVTHTGVIMRRIIPRAGISFQSRFRVDAVEPEPGLKIGANRVTGNCNYLKKTQKKT